MLCLPYFNVVVTLFLRSVPYVFSLAPFQALLVQLKSCSQQLLLQQTRYVPLKSRGVPLLLSIIVVISVNPVRVPRLLVRPDRARLLRTKLHLNQPFLPYSSHLRQDGGGLDLVGVLLEHGRELRRKLFHLVIEALGLAEADGVLLSVELQLHHLVRIAESPVARQIVSPLSVGRYSITHKGYFYGPSSSAHTRGRSSSFPPGWDHPPGRSIPRQ